MTGLLLFSFQFLKCSMIFLFICLLSVSRKEKMPLSHLFACHPSRQIKCCIFWKPTSTSLDKVKAYSFSGHSACDCQPLMKHFLLPTRPLKKYHESGSGISWTRRWSHMPSYHQQNKNKRSVCLFWTSVGTKREFFSSSLPLSANWFRNAQALGDGGITAQEEPSLCGRTSWNKACRWYCRNVMETRGFICYSSLT